ncbi:GreA/GreB family elongation factor [Lutibacter sp. A80]|uniref:GreA/GreB family elongation factor n=1 Tax=Lutibacter sp. A80 TaxID=2918453 RepID=UPI001F06597B|nr:GreA/GreB family elongation factor [Lutibacter sp. A80]UMB59770.1 GreA/GreB family elongation factor [Lutibacter sp. A80]
MKNYLKIKQQLLEHCFYFVQQKSTVISQSIASNKNDLFSETKSSAGDKHETGRAMIQLEMEKASQQLAEITAMNTVLNKVTIDKPTKVICLGSLIKTTKGTYFLAISVGKILIENVAYFIISAQSPIGKQLLGQKVGATLAFNNAEILEIF